MGRKQTAILIRSKRLGLIVGCAAVVLMGILAIAWNDPGGHSMGVVAGSGRGNGGGVYVQPSVKGMNQGATATWTAPATTPTVEKARPPLG